jgi:hypothetical protein
MVAFMGSQLSQISANTQPRIILRIGVSCRDAQTVPSKGYLLATRQPCRNRVELRDTPQKLRLNENFVVLERTRWSACAPSRPESADLANVRHYARRQRHENSVIRPSDARMRAEGSGSCTKGCTS